MTGQTVVGTFIVTAIITGMLQVLGIVTEPDPGITVHGLSFEVVDEAPTIVQDRTVTAEGTLTARWEAKIHLVLDASETEICDGHGYWDYQGGRIKAQIPVDDWVGDIGCFSRIPDGGRFRACAEYKWGDAGIERRCSAVLTKPE